MVRSSLVALALLVMSSCTSLVFPPRHCAQPVNAFVLRDNRHLGLLLPDPPEAPVAFFEYGYGDHAWFALAQQQWYRVFPTILWPTQATLCRRVWPFDSVDELQRRVAMCGCEVDLLVVERARVVALRERLDAAFVGRESVRRPEFSMEFVPYDGSYWMFETCADVAADWCRELGCEVSYALIRGSLRVKACTALPVPTCGG
ncbi:MAG: hypothetical protein ABL997_20260 [Planctomycetota bacterium]